jgi:hypothetical protein
VPCPMCKPDPPRICRGKSPPHGVASTAAKCQRARGDLPGPRFPVVSMFQWARAHRLFPLPSNIGGATGHALIFGPRKRTPVSWRGRARRLVCRVRGTPVRVRRSGKFLVFPVPFFICTETEYSVVEPVRIWLSFNAVCFAMYRKI